MSTLFSYKQGARLPSVELTLESSADYDLSQATTVEFRYRKKSEVTVETTTCAVTDAPTKKVRLDVTANMVDEVGIFQCHVKVTIGGLDMFFPQVGFDDFRVTESF